MKQLTDRLFDAVKDIWDGYLEQPFVKGLGDGTLSEEQFRFYTIQDYLYLIQYAKVFAMGIIKSDKEEVMLRFAAMVGDTLGGETSIHKTGMRLLNLTLEEIEKNPTAMANSAYTAYMLDVAHKGGPLDIIVAVLSCGWSYEYIGKHLNDIPGANSHPLFGHWVSGYASEGYHQAAQDLIDMVNELGKNVTPEEEEHLVEIFVNCSRHEKNFWDMAYRMEM